MRTLCPNFDNEDGLETVLEVPMPEEAFASMGSNALLRWQNIRSKMRAQLAGKQASDDLFMMLLKIVSSPVIPYQDPVLQPQLPLTSVRDGSFVSAFPFLDLIAELNLNVLHALGV